MPKDDLQKDTHNLPTNDSIVEQRYQEYLDYLSLIEHHMERELEHA